MPSPHLRWTGCRFLAEAVGSVLAVACAFGQVTPSLNTALKAEPVRPSEKYQYVPRQRPVIENVEALEAIVAKSSQADPAKALLPPLTVEELLRSVDHSYPLLEIAIRERDIAQGGYTSAQGSFDLKMKGKAQVEQFGFYRHETFDGLLEQPLEAFGATVYGGYKLGRGSYSPAEDLSRTLSLGEGRVGVNMPLFQNRAIDDRRTGLIVNDLQRDVTEYGIEKQRLSIYKGALKQYWEWVAAGQNFQVAVSLLRLAELRNTQIAESVQLGQLAPIELTDNQQTILRRRSAVVSASRALQSAAIELSLYYRDPAGLPLVPESNRLPNNFPDPFSIDQSKFQQDVQFALTERPELRGLQVKREQQRAEVRLADNKLLPQLDLFLQYSRDGGVGSITKRGNNIESGLFFELPAQRRKASGKLLQQEAKFAQIESEFRFTRDRVVADVQDALSAVRNAFEGLGVVAKEVETAKRLEEAERAKFDLGDSTQFLVNLRELATADAQVRQVKAQSDLFKAMAEYDAATTRIFTKYNLPRK